MLILPLLLTAGGLGPLPQEPWDAQLKENYVVGKSLSPLSPPGIECVALFYSTLYLLEES